MMATGEKTVNLKVTSEKNSGRSSLFCIFSCCFPWPTDNSGGHPKLVDNDNDNAPSYQSLDHSTSGGPPSDSSSLCLSESLTFVPAMPSAPWFSGLSGVSPGQCEVQGWFCGHFAFVAEGGGRRLISVRKMPYSLQYEEERLRDCKTMNKAFYQHADNQVFVKFVRTDWEVSSLKNEINLGEELSKDRRANNFFLFLQPVTLPQTVEGAAGWGRLSGRDLYYFIRNDQPYVLENYSKFSMQLYNALIYLHTKKVFHRDIKPENVVVDDRVVKIIDFGLSQMSDNEWTDRFVGTPGYFDPRNRVNRNGKVFYNMKRSDRTASILVVLQMVYGIKPFNAFDQWQSGELRNKFDRTTSYSPDFFLNVFAGDRQDPLRSALGKWFHCPSKKEGTLFEEMMLSPPGSSKAS